MPTESITVDSGQAFDVRKILASYVRLTVQEKRHWVFWRKFVVSGSPDAVKKAVQEANQWLEADWWSRQL